MHDQMWEAGCIELPDAWTEGSAGGWETCHVRSLPPSKGYVKGRVLAVQAMIVLLTMLTRTSVVDATHVWEQLARQNASAP